MGLFGSNKKDKAKIEELEAANIALENRLKTILVDNFLPFDRTGEVTPEMATEMIRRSVTPAKVDKVVKAIEAKIKDQSDKGRNWVTESSYFDYSTSNRKVVNVAEEIFRQRGFDVTDSSIQWADAVNETETKDQSQTS